MKEFTCSCGWKFILGKKRFYGPIINDAPNLARIQPIADFKDGYGDCYGSWERWVK